MPFQRGASTEPRHAPRCCESSHPLFLRPGPTRQPARYHCPRTTAGPCSRPPLLCGKDFPCSLSNPRPGVLLVLNMPFPPNIGMLLHGGQIILTWWEIQILWIYFFRWLLKLIWWSFVFWKPASLNLRSAVPVGLHSRSLAAACASWLRGLSCVLAWIFIWVN